LPFEVAAISERHGFEIYNNDEMGASVPDCYRDAGAQSFAKRVNSLIPLYLIPLYPINLFTSWDRIEMAACHAPALPGPELFLKIHP